MVGPASSSRQYSYKKPSSFNLVSALMLLALAAGVYGAWKFGPVYYKRYKVDEILRAGSAEASGIRALNQGARAGIEERVLAGVVDRLGGLGIDAERSQLAVYFDDAYASLHADYVVVVRHPGGKRTTMNMHRSVPISE
jgi:hypothetical protein